MVYHISFSNKDQKGEEKKGIHLEDKEPENDFPYDTDPQNEPPNYFQSLPEELGLEICSYLRLFDLCKMTQVLFKALLFLTHSIDLLSIRQVDLQIECTIQEGEFLLPQVIDERNSPAQVQARLG